MDLAQLWCNFTARSIVDPKHQFLHASRLQSSSVSFNWLQQVWQKTNRHR